MPLFQYFACPCRVLLHLGEFRCLPFRELTEVFSSLVDIGNHIDIFAVVEGELEFFFVFTSCLLLATVAPRHLVRKKRQNKKHDKTKKYFESY